MDTAPEADSPFLSAEQKRTAREAKRAAVLRAAVQMFNRRGFHQTSLDDVAASLGISKPTIYHYLGNKDQVLLECVVIGLGQLIDLAEHCRTLPGSGADRLIAYLTRYAEINMDDFGRCVIRTAEEALAPESRARFRHLKRRIDADMRGFIAAGMADGSLAPGDVKLTAFALAGALNWPARWQNPEGEDAPDAIARKLVEFLGHGFTPRA
ncbi:TetR/AcrR family transcriptional regulator [Novosphingobium cyanobacteriorum]|uniref:TetR/AcrR family transcriptional regulator n=1 Tax=Novosphingobium cyanobacteriorum TaxID=3024215 RepID=A0ABT6CIG7_9SPHN|nr:TetR/AcrR family transcriptional regulator [Novosphingobium cyanobacteriorum]MDF8333711.1 TetR/AcrR family transcriptional regulator [Novosphingobium cyanobacteriorum]